MPDRKFLLMRAVALIGLLAFSACSGRNASLTSVMQDVRSRNPDVREITTNDLAALDGVKKPRILDARSWDEFEVSHIPGARWIGDPEALTNLDPGGDGVVVYCSVGYRSAAFARQVSTRGFAHASNLSGGIFKWANEGRPLHAARGDARKVHSYSSSWQHLLASHLRYLP